MKKLIFLLAILWLGLNAFAKSVQADEYGTAVVGHIIKNSSEIDHGKLLENEMQKLAYLMMLHMADTLEKTMPYIIEELTAQLRQESDKLYKCGLVKDTAMECK